MNEPLSKASIEAYVNSTPAPPNAEIDARQYLRWLRRQSGKPYVELDDKGLLQASTPNLCQALLVPGWCGYHFRLDGKALQAAPYDAPNDWAPIVWSDLKQSLIDRLGMHPAPIGRLKDVTRWAVAQDKPPVHTGFPTNRSN